MTEQDLLKMKLHDRLSVSNTGQTTQWILRVIGGWIYYRQTTINAQRGTSNFPFDLHSTATFVPEPRSILMDYDGYEDWLQSSPEPEPEPDQSVDAETRLETLGHY